MWRCELQVVCSHILAASLRGFPGYQETHGAKSEAELMQSIVFVIHKRSLSWNRFISLVSWLVAFNNACFTHFVAFPTPVGRHPYSLIIFAQALYIHIYSYYMYIQVWVMS